MKRYVIALAIVAAIALYIGHSTVKTVKAAQYKQQTALSVADQIN